MRIGLWLARFLLLTGLIVGVGGAAFNAFIERDGLPPGARIVTAALVLGLVAAPLLVGFQGLDALSAPFSDLVTAEVWQAGLWATSYGGSTLIAVTAIFWPMQRECGSRSRFGVGPAGAGLLLVGVAVASAGHASTASPRYLTIPAVFLHAVTVVVWIGALVPLGAVLLRGGTALPIVLARFTRYPIDRRRAGAVGPAAGGRAGAIHPSALGYRLWSRAPGQARAGRRSVPVCRAQPLLCDRSRDRRRHWLDPTADAQRRR